ncbi:uncharacterized protein LOC143290485 [Babylonia areolata]|uniref:uncharacterized protein LOC143290485 n=1 Tax=Babylonia areolata TaxID=304850 RepID=UPI003FD44AFE
MGSFVSRSPTRFEVEELRQDFGRMTEIINSRLPWIALARNGTVVLLLCGTCFMIAAATTLYPEGGGVAGALVTFALLLHLVSFVLRECIVIPRTQGLLEKFHEAVPEYMDTSDVPEPRGDGLLSLILLLEAVSLVAGFLFRLHWLLSLFACIALVASTFLLGRKVIRDGNDFELRVACQVCVKNLEKLLSAGEEV